MSETITWGTSNTADNGIYGDTLTPGRWGQKFVPSGNASQAIVHITTNKGGSPTDNLIVGIFADDGSNHPNNASLLGSASKAMTSLTSSFAVYDFTITGLSLVASTTYWCVVYRDGNSVVDFARITYDTGVTTDHIQYTTLTAWINDVAAELFGSVDLSSSGIANLKTYNTNAKANIKTMNTNPIANVKTFDTNV